MSTVDSFGAKSTLTVGGTDYEIYRVDTVAGYEKLPFSLRCCSRTCCAPKTVRT